MSNKFKALVPQKLYNEVVNHLQIIDLKVDLNSVKSEEINNGFRHSIAYIIGEQKTGFYFSLYKSIYNTKNVYSTNLSVNNNYIGIVELL